MKSLIVFILVCFAVPALAQSKESGVTASAGSELPVEIPKDVEIADSWATLKLQFDSNVEPTWHPIAMKLMMTCKDQRKTPNNVKPEEKNIALHSTIGEFGSHSFNEKDNVLTLIYFISDTEEGPAEVDKKITYKADLKTLCKAYGP